MTMRLYRPQYTLRQLMIIVAALACMAALYQWFGLVVAFLIMWMPFCLLAERLVAGAPRSETRPTLGWMIMDFMVMTSCALVAVAARWVGARTGVPTVLSPLPLFGVLPLFYVPDPWFASLFPFGTFFLVNFYLGRTAGRNPVPLRFPILLGTATAYSAYWLIGGWKYGVRYQSFFYANAVAILNLGALVVLWSLWLVLRGGATKPAAFALATLFHCWLFGMAFPWLGELP
jgi:hypothetical protein